MNMDSFSGGYYSLDMQIQEYSDGPVIESGLHNYIDRKVYSQTDAPVTFKLSMNNGTYFTVDSEAAVPPSVLAIPQSWVDNLDVPNEGQRRRVFVLKPAYSQMINQ